MLQGEHSAILLTFIKLPFVIKIFVLCIFGWPFYTGFTVVCRVVLLYSVNWVSVNWLDKNMYFCHISNSTYVP